MYAKFVCHNICVLIAEMYTLGIQAMFEKPATAVAADYRREDGGSLTGDGSIVTGFGLGVAGACSVNPLNQ